MCKVKGATARGRALPVIPTLCGMSEDATRKMRKKQPPTTAPREVTARQLSKLLTKAQRGERSQPVTQIKTRPKKMPLARHGKGTHPSNEEIRETATRTAYARICSSPRRHPLASIQTQVPSGWPRGSHRCTGIRCGTILVRASART